jgi:polyisoprenoid-binding protein YceI
VGRRLLLVIAGSAAGIAVLAFGGLYVYIALSNRDAPPPVSLTPQTALPTAAVGTSAAPSGSAVAASSCDTAAPDGTWAVASDGQSFAGYRVNEKLASLPTRSDAVGRTNAVTGGMTITGSAVRAADFTADLTRLTSNEMRRDNYIRHDGLESSTFPTATFSLTGPLPFGAIPATGQAVSVTAHGSLTLHGVKRVRRDRGGRLAAGRLRRLRDERAEHRRLGQRRRPWHHGAQTGARAATLTPRRGGGVP